VIAVFIDRNDLSKHLPEELQLRYGADSHKRSWEVCILIILLIVVSWSLYNN